MQDIKECAAEAGMEMSAIAGIVTKLQSGQDLMGDVRNKFGCTALCVFKKLVVWSNDGFQLIPFEALASKIPFFNSIPNPREALRECAAQKGANDCDTSYLIAKCLISKFLPISL